MGLFDFLRKSAGHDPLAAFYSSQPGWEAYRSSNQILGFFRRHPHWSQINEAILIELTRRITTPPFPSVAYSYSDAFFVIAMITEKYRVVETNFLPTCRDRNGIDGNTIDGKLWMFAWTLQRLSNRLLSEADSLFGRADPQTISHRFEDAKCAAEACLTVDPWFHTAYTILPVPWVARAGDFTRAFAICDEGVKVCEHLRRHGSSLSCELDRQMAAEAPSTMTAIEAVRQRLAAMRGTPAH